MIHSQVSRFIQVSQLFHYNAVLMVLRDVYMSHSGDLQRVFRYRFIGLLVFIKFMHYLLFQPPIASKISVMFC